MKSVSNDSYGYNTDPSIAKKVIEHWDEVLRSREDESNNCMSLHE